MLDINKGRLSRPLFCLSMGLIVAEQAQNILGGVDLRRAVALGFVLRFNQLLGILRTGHAPLMNGMHHFFQRSFFKLGQADIVLLRIGMPAKVCGVKKQFGKLRGGAENNLIVWPGIRLEKADGSAVFRLRSQTELEVCPLGNGRAGYLERTDESLADDAFRVIGRGFQDVQGVIGLDRCKKRLCVFKRPVLTAIE